MDTNWDMCSKAASITGGIDSSGHYGKSVNFLEYFVIDD
jgi:hypothetical protein